MEDKVQCIKGNINVDLTCGKHYRVIPDDKAAANGQIRIVDESGEGYLYPSAYFLAGCTLEQPTAGEELHIRSRLVVGRFAIALCLIVACFILVGLIAIIFLKGGTFVVALVANGLTTLVAILTTAWLALRAIDRIHSTRSKS